MLRYDGVRMASQPKLRSSASGFAEATPDIRTAEVLSAEALANANGAWPESNNYQ